MADPALKLFGRTIQVADIGSSSGSDVDPVTVLGCENKDTYLENKSAEEAPIEIDQVEQQNSSSSLNTTQDNNDQQASSKSDKEKSESADPPDAQEKALLKKPDKILPCPRCNSLDTKFCYYNNYNVNQPRHFCKNCQRYWTAGGTMRNVPVGAGRRKNKHSVPHFRPIIVPSESTIKFGGGEATPTFESASSVFNLNEQMRKTEISTANEDPSSASSSSNAVPETANVNNAAPLHPLQYYAGPPWAFSWGIPPILGPPFCAPLPFLPPPPPFWPAMGPWTVPWTAPNNNENNGCNSPMLGKHSRDEATVTIQGNDGAATEKKSLWVPKTLRIDDPDEAAKSSIWTTLGIKPDDEGGMFKAYKSKAKSEGHKVDASSSPPLLTANPAALSRSHSFQEGV